MILIISGTNRPESNTRKVARRIEAVYELLGVEIQVLDLAELPPEIFSPTSYAEKPANFNPSTLRTVASAVDFLGWLFDRATFPGADVITEARVLVVDDELLSRRAITFALDKAKLKSISAEDPTVALKLVTENPFDLIFLDVDMPGMTGFELCTKIRALSRHWKTPVIFVTSLTGFEVRANSTMSGGNDFIAKPFLFVELAVKALVYVIRARMESQPRPATVAPAPALAAR